MNRICWRCAELASRTLKPDERDAVRGDLAESGASGSEALRDVLGLVVRRQIALWRSWRPWVALFGIVGIAAIWLSKTVAVLDSGVFIQLRTYLHYRVHFETGATVGRNIVYLASLSVGLFAWSWTSGFVLASLSGRAVWLTGALFYIVVLDSFRGRLLFSGRVAADHSHVLPFPVMVVAAAVPLGISKLLFLLAAMWGAQKGLRLHRLGFRGAFLLALTAAFLASLLTWASGWYETWSGEAFRAVPWSTRVLPFALMSWPAAYLLGTSRHGKIRNLMLWRTSK